MIDIFLSNGNVYVWAGEAASELRETHRIVGTLVGCLPRLPRQNIHLGLPLQLLPEEVTLLINAGIVRILQNTPASPEISESEIKTFQEDRQKLYHKQIELCRAEAKKRTAMNLPNIEEGLRAKKRKELKKKREEGEEVSDSEFERVEFDIEKVEIPPLPEKHSCIQIHTACSREKQFPVAEWNFPTTPEEILRYRVFKDLHDKGHWLTSGGKFGGDFLVYPGDPSRFHSFYIAICIPFHKKLAAMDIMTFSRLGANVKKTVTLCSLDESDDVTYTSLQWSGIT